MGAQGCGAGPNIGGLDNRWGRSKMTGNSREFCPPAIKGTLRDL